MQFARQNIMTEIDMTAAYKLPKRGAALLRIFSRFEYALKEINHAAPGKHNGEATVLWDKFANECLGRDFFQYIRKQGIAPTLLSKPPSMQVVDGALGWKKVPPPGNVQDLFGAVRRVRNNLFHGGKSGDPDADRNAKLVLAALETLRPVEKDGELGRRLQLLDGHRGIGGLAFAPFRKRSRDRSSASALRLSPTITARRGSSICRRPKSSRAISPRPSPSSFPR